MKQLILFYILVAIFNINAQNSGAIIINCKDFKTLQPFTGIETELWQDSICFSRFSNDQGKALFQGLPHGFVQLRYYLQGRYIGEEQLFVQDRQVVNTTVFFDTIYKQQAINRTSNTFEYDRKGQPKNERTITFTDHTISASNYKTVREISIVAYKVPLIQMDGGVNYQRITHDDLAKMPVRSAPSMATTVGGVQQNEATGGINVRGTREDASCYFIDGVKVRGSSQLPKSAIKSVQVYTGGIPANYGDLTGGVVDITTKNSTDRNYFPSRNKRGHYDNKKTEKTERKRTDEEIAYDDFYNAMNYESFTPIYENNFLSPLLHPHATFGLDVDQAAWGFVKNAIAQGRPIQRDAVKLEEMINAFNHKKIEVPEKELLHVNIERNTCAWNPNNELVTIHLKARDIPADQPRKPHNFVFLIDVSGSMASENRLPLLVKGMKAFVHSLLPNDRVAIVTYAGNSGVVLPSTTCEKKSSILKALNSLEARGGTNGYGGIQEAYKQAEKNFDSKYNNRIILATDGDFNVGINSPGDLKQFIETKRGKGIYLTALGFGMGNYKNSTLEALAKSGDGNHFYIRNINDSKKVLGNIGNLMNIARDVKLNVEFNPHLVANYRLIGYENRLLLPKDFDDDTKDAGELGYGHQVTAVFEIEKGKAETIESHFTKQKSNPAVFGSGKKELAFVKLRYKPMEDSTSIERRYALNTTSECTKNELLNLVIAFGLNLRDSAFKGKITSEEIIQMAKDFHATEEEEIELKNAVIGYFTGKV